jgi:predicted peroxiredoxin
MEITSKVRKLIYRMFDDMIEGADKYVTKSSMWLIFTEEKRWVIEFTNTKTLWFNYNLFQSELNLLSMDCVDSKDIIKEWFESRFLEKDIAHVTDTSNVPYSIVENTIQNGVKDTQTRMRPPVGAVDEIIQNGVKYVKDVFEYLNPDFEDTLKNGVKETRWSNANNPYPIEDTIQNGVKRVKSDEGYMNHIKQIHRAEQTIQNGVKDIGARHLRVGRKVQDVIQNGVKEVKTPGVGDLVSTVEWMDENNTYNVPELIDEVIQNGVKETYAHPTIDDIEIEDTIQTGVKVIMSGSEWYHKDEVENLVKNGVKE